MPEKGWKAGNSKVQSSQESWIDRRRQEADRGSRHDAKEWLQSADKVSRWSEDLLSPEKGPQAGKPKVRS